MYGAKRKKKANCDEVCGTAISFLIALVAAIEMKR